MYLNWLADNWLEVLGAIAGLVYLYFSINQLIWLWPLGLVTSVLYIFVFFKARFYADMSLQFYYVFISIYGWIHWLKVAKRNEVRSGNENENENENELVVRSIGLNYYVILILITFILTFAIGMFLSRFTDSPLPFWDAFTTSGSIVATWMLARKILENWIFWIVIDFTAMGTYIYKGLYPTVLLFLVYTLLAFIGYRQWKKDMLKNL